MQPECLRQRSSRIRMGSLRTLALVNVGLRLGHYLLGTTQRPTRYDCATRTFVYTRRSAHNPKGRMCDSAPYHATLLNSEATLHPCILMTLENQKKTETLTCMLGTSTVTHREVIASADALSHILIYITHLQRCRPVLYCARQRCC